MIKLELIKDSKNYYITNSGNVVRLLQGRIKNIKGWKEWNLPIPYRRVWICYKNGSRKKQYNHILTAIYFKGGDKRDDGLIVLHGEKGHENNTDSNISWGTRYKNNVDDRKRDGTYMKRGIQVQQDCPF